MKIKRSKLRNVIKEFLNTYKPDDSSIPKLDDMTDASVYDQVSNSERAAFVASMGIAEKAHADPSLKEGTTIPFPRNRASKKLDAERDEGEIFRFQPYNSGLPGDITNVEESDPEDLSFEEIEMLRNILNTRRNVQTDVRTEDSMPSDLDDDFEAYLQGMESGNLVDLFEEED